MKRAIRLDDLQVFLSTAEAGSLTAAAHHLNVTPALASAAVQRLESRLGARLFIRSTRNLRLSPEGDRYLPYVLAALAALGEGENALNEGLEDISGLIRISLPSDPGRNILLDWIDDFQVKYPRIEIQVFISDQVADFFSDFLDVSIRYGQLMDSGLVALPLVSDNRRSAYASPAYLREHGQPLIPDELQDHNCLCYIINGRRADRWMFHMQDGVRNIQITGNRISDDADVVRRWAISGKGIAYKSQFDVAGDVREGKLVELFPDIRGQSAPLQMVCAHRHSVSTSIRLLREFLASRCQQWLAGIPEIYSGE